jgi:Asp-tRNA(Asn)/Glu-tRNA(Gln) amidotransferase A subunit family amidase
LVEAFRAGERSPREELEATLGAIEASSLNAFCHLDAERALERAEQSDPSLPFGGVPVAVKELDPVKGWPGSHGSLVLKDEVYRYDSTMVKSLRAAGANLFGQTTASEFGGINCTHTKLHGTTRNPWNQERTPGGSSGGSAAAVAGGLCTIATAGDGGGSIRIPAGFTGLFGLKTTFGRISLGPHLQPEPLTVTLGCVSRSVRDWARWLDVCTGVDPRDPFSLPKVEGWERGLGTHQLAGLRVAIAPNLGCATVLPAIEEMVAEHAELMAKDAGLQIVNCPVKLPEGSIEWAIANSANLLNVLGDRYPDCEEDLTVEIAFALKVASQIYDLKMAARVDAYRESVYEAFADVFDQVDFIVAATNPDVAFNASGPLPDRVGDVACGLGNNGALTIPCNISGNPAVNIPIGTLDGLPVGMQVIGRRHEEALLLDLARVVELERPWPLTAPSAPA